MQDEGDRQLSLKIILCRGYWPDHKKKIHCGESRWLATPKRCRFARRHGKTKLMGVASRLAIDPFQVVWTNVGTLREQLWKFDPD